MININDINAFRKKRSTINTNPQLFSVNIYK